MEINRWVQSIHNRVRRNIIAGNQPSLAEFINHKDDTPLNDNVIGEVFVIDFKNTKNEHWKAFQGKRRVKVVDYDRTANSFLMDSIGLDVCENTHDWYSFEIDLNKELEHNTLTHIPKNEVVQLPPLGEIAKGIYFNSNVIGRDITIQTPGIAPYQVKVIDYQSSSDSHVIQLSDGGIREVSLNELFHSLNIVPDSYSFFKEALCHFPPPPNRVPSGDGPWRSQTGILRSGSNAARPMQKCKAI